MTTGKPTKGQRAYTLRRDTGKSWKAVAREVDSASPEAAISAAKKYARTVQLPWPIRTLLDKARKKARQDELRAQAKRDARVYHRVASGTPVGSISGLSVTTVYRALDRHAEVTGEALIARNAERAYNLRVKERLTWQQIATRLGVRETSAIEAAREFAGARGLQWPVTVIHEPAPDEYVGKTYYEEVRDGRSWREVSEDARKTISYIKGRAKVYAKAFILPWPI